MLLWLLGFCMTTPVHSLEAPHTKEKMMRGAKCGGHFETAAKEPSMTRVRVHVPVDHICFLFHPQSRREG